MRLGVSGRGKKVDDVGSSGVADVCEVERGQVRSRRDHGRGWEWETG